MRIDLERFGSYRGDILPFGLLDSYDIVDFEILIEQWCPESISLHPTPWNRSFVHRMVAKRVPVDRMVVNRMELNS